MGVGVGLDQYRKNEKVGVGELSNTIVKHTNGIAGVHSMNEK